MEIALAALLGGGLMSGAVALYRARSDKESAVSTAAKGLAEASAALVNPLRTELVATRERIVALEAEVHLARQATLSCQELVTQLHAKIDHLDARLTAGEEKIVATEEKVVETKEKVAKAEDRITEVENGE